ncbi:MAG: hypothetical protein H6559_18470 [Lewinellaceae bacterium]|nr:hypothetical protein [Lewinellaceae bacterium]
MKAILLSATLALTTVASLSAQTLYQDALTLAELLRKERTEEEVNEGPRLVFMKERKGVYCSYNQNTSSASFSPEEDEISGNQIVLDDPGYYALRGYDKSDTIYIQFAKDIQVQVYTEGDSMTMIKQKEKNAVDTVKVPFDSLLTIHNAYRTLSILGSKRQMLCKLEHIAHISVKIRSVL